MFDTGTDMYVGYFADKIADCLSAVSYVSV